MMKRKIIIIMLCLSMLVSASGLVYCAATVDVTNYFETGVVDINLTEYQVVDGKETEWVDNPTILPGDAISKIPRISNDGNDCYVRAKLTFRGTDEVGEENLFGIGNKWVKADDGYWYYLGVLSHGESVDIFEGLLIPEDFSQEYEGETFYVDVDVDAIQSKNFTPDFSLSQPWGSVEILKFEKSDEYDVNKFKTSDTKSFEIVYRGDSGKLVKNQEDFFTNFPYLMPGDTYSDVAILENDGNKDITIYFRTEDIDNSELLDKLQLKITTVIEGVEKVIYNGDLRATYMNKNTKLGVIKAGKNAEFKYEVYMPAELNNKYTLMDSRVKWIFTTELNDTSSNPKTSDSTTGLLVASVVMFVLSCCGFVVLGTTKRKEEGVNEGLNQNQGST